MVRSEEKLYGVISALTDEYNNYDKLGKRLRKPQFLDLVNDLEIVDEELHDLKTPPITDGIQIDNKVCMFYVITELKDILTEKDDQQKMIMLTEFYNTLVFNLGVNALNNHNNDWEK
jgi:hypothetical protein|tara:strand:+ start:210 stop:560 length:351 start_codon:yes stop_codon:yes gene_type:complete